MPRARDSNRNKAFQIYMDAGGKIDLAEIASQLNIFAGTVRGWKSKDKWEEQLNGTLQTKVTERSKRSKGGQPERSNMETKRIGTEQTLTSIEVAGMVQKEHGKLMRDIRRYTGQLGEAKIGFTDFWKESTYTTEQNKIHPCYLITKKGCEFIAHKLTGEKGTRFTALYINRFHEMEDALMEQQGEYPSMHDIVDAMSRQTKIITNLVGRIEKLEQGKSYARLLPAGDRDGSAHREIAKRAEYLGELVGEVARVAGYPKNIIFRAMYEKLEREFGISLDVYLYVARNEYRADACTLHAVVMWDRLYERAVQVNQEEIAKRKVYS